MLIRFRSLGGYLRACAIAALFAANAEAQLRVVTYNTATAQGGSGTQTAREPYSTTILEAIGLESINGLARPIDVLLLQEQFSLDLTTDSFVDILNDLYDPINRTMYARGTVSGLASSDFIQDPGLQGSGGRPAMVYNTQTVELISEDRFGSVGSGTAQARQFLRYEFRPVGYDSNADFYAYSSHYRAGDDADQATSRFNEAVVLRNNSDALGEGTHAIYAGDYNITSSTTTMFDHLLSSGAGQAFDPINIPGTWHDNQMIGMTDIRHVHTQSPAATGENIPGYAGGGMDDRFDFQLVTGEMLDSEGMSILPGSYHAFGNNGTHNLNGSITTGTGAAPDILDALKANSDHLPVVADYQLPAKMLASLASVPTNVAQGAMVGIDVLVQNIAPVLNANWADELDYTVSVSGDLLGSATGTSFPLAAANAHPIFLDTGTSGFRNGVVTVSATSQGTANPLYQFPVNFIVGAGNGGPVFGVIAKDTFDEDENLLSFSQTPEAGTFADPQDGFQEYQVGVSSSIPNALKDDSNNGFSIDALGVVDTATKLDRWFGINDLENPSNTGGTGTLVWEFDVAGAIDMQVSIDMAAMGDFEDGEDTYDWTYQFDDGPLLELFTSSVDDDHPAVPYTMADGDVVNIADPLFMTNAQEQIVQLTNSFQTLTSLISGLGDVLTITLNVANNADEPFAFDNLIVEGTTFVEFLEADFNQDGTVDDLDLADWQSGYGASDVGDADFDGDTDGRDFLIWQRQYGQSIELPLAASVAVPEPAGLVLSAIVALLGLVRQRSNYQ